MTNIARRTFPILLSALLLFVLLLAGGCGEDRERAIGEGYVPGAVALRDRLGPGSTEVADLKPGERVEILQRRRSWVRVRGSDGARGWMLERYLMSSEMYQKGRALLNSSAALPSQGRARLRDLANAHLEAARQSPTMFQFQEDEEVDVLGHRVVERPLPPGLAAAEQEQAGSEEGAAKADAARPRRKAPARPRPRLEDWFLLRGEGKAGWVLAQFVDMDLPFDIVQHAEGDLITAWQKLDEFQDGDQTRGHYVWATNSQAGPAHDFDGVRVFIWNGARSRYETAFRERRLRGVYPLTAGQVKLADGRELPSFSVTVVDGAGNRVTREFVLVGTAVRRRDEVR